MCVSHGKALLALRSALDVHLYRLDRDSEIAPSYLFSCGNCCRVGQARCCSTLWKNSRVQIGLWYCFPISLLLCEVSAEELKS